MGAIILLLGWLIFMVLSLSKRVHALEQSKEKVYTKQSVATPPGKPEQIHMTAAEYQKFIKNGGKL